MTSRDDRYMKNSYKVFHSPCVKEREKIHIVLVEPEHGGNVGAAARALANMGIHGSFRIVGNKKIIDENALRLAKHARARLDEILFFSTLEDALKTNAHATLILGATARIGSAHRPHPLRVRTAMERAMRKLRLQEIEELYLVFGRESDGLTNEEIDLCDWVVTIPSLKEYRSLNLAQAVLIFCYEANTALISEWDAFRTDRPSQKEKLVMHMIRLAEEVGFILPGDPFKMRPRLEEIFSPLPNHIQDIKTLHGLLDQIRRTVKKGGLDIKGRYKKYSELPARFE